MQAASDLEALEREEEMQRKERASKLAAISARERAEKEAAAAEEKRRAAAAAAAQMQSTSMKRGREPANHGPPWPRLPPQKAYAVAQAITQSKPLPEVVNFIISALLHHIPPAETVPGAMRSIQNSRTSVGRAAPEEPALKRTRKSRFGAKEPERPSNQPAPPVLKKKVAVVRKVAPVVVPVRLTSTTVEKLVTFCCRRILKKESQAIASGAGPLRIQLLARLLTRLSQQDQGMLAHQFCEEVCAYIAEDIDHNMDLAQAWLFKLASEASLVKIAHETSPSMPLLEAVVEKGIAKKPEEPGEKPEPIIADQEMKASLPVDRNMKVEAVPESTEAEVPPTSKDRKATGKIEHDVKQESQVEKDEHIANGDEKPAKKEVNESTNDTIGEEVEVDILDALHVDGSYDRIFNRLLELLAGKQPFVGDSFSQIICEAPVLPQSVFESLKNFCNDPSKIKVGLHSLRDIVLKRPGEDRTKCLSLLLSFTTNDDEVLRGPSIRLVANHLFAECVGEVPQMIERHAVKSLNAAIQSLSENSTPDELDSLERACLLLTALCGQKHTLLREIAKSYVSMTPAGRHILLQRAKSLAGELGMSSIPIVQLIAAKLLPMKPRKDGDTFETDGLEILALEVLRALLKKFGKPTEELVEAACTRHDITGNTAFIIAVLPGLRKESLLKHLAAIVNSVHNPRSVEEKGSSEEKSGPTGETSKTAGFKEIINIVMSSRPPPISASEMLFELHCIEPNSAVHTALLACFELKSVYKQEVIAQAIQQLIEKTVIPDLLMRTVLLARIHCPEMEKYLTGTVLKRLIDKQVWKNSILWEGFLFYCASVKEKSLKVLLSLPAPQLKEALDREEDLLVTFKGLFANPKNLKKAPSVKHRKVIQAAIQKPAKDS